MEQKQKETQANLSSFFGQISQIREEIEDLEESRAELNDKIKKAKKELEKAIKSGIEAAGY